MGHALTKGGISSIMCLPDSLHRASFQIIMDPWKSWIGALVTAI